MTTSTVETHVFEADVARLLHMMVHSVYSDKNVFLRELISNAADACEKLRYEAIAQPELLAGETKGKITVTLDEARQQLTIEDNGIGMSRDEMIEALGTIARSGTRAFLERIEASKAGDGAQLIGQFGVGFYSSFMVAEKVDVVSRRAGADEAWLWSSDGKGGYSVDKALPQEAPRHGTRVTLHLMDDAKSFASRWTVERIIKEQSGHVPIPVELIENPGAEPLQIADGTALWTRPKADISPDEYTDFYRSASGQYDQPALTVHFRAEGRHEYTALAFVPETPPFDLFDPDRKGRMKLYVRRVHITDDAELVPRYLRFVRGLVDSADLPLNVSREMIQESPVLAAIRKGVTNRVLAAIEKFAENEAEKYLAFWKGFGSVLKEGLYEDFERREQLLKLSRFRTTISGDNYRSLSEYIRDAKDGQEAIYFLSGSSTDQLASSPQLEGFRARGLEVLLLADSIDSFWTMNAPAFDGKTFKSITQGDVDLTLFPAEDQELASDGQLSTELEEYLTFAKQELADEVSDVRVSERLTESAVCIVAPENGYDRNMERLLQGSGRIQERSKPILELNAANAVIKAIAASKDTALRSDAAFLLLDQARVLDGDRPSEPREFAARLQRVLGKIALG
jgi:molecular chaperone HtpG